MAEPPPRKPKVPRRRELEESYKSLEAAAAARRRRDMELFEAAERSKFEAENRQGSGSVIRGESIEPPPLLPPAPPSTDFAFGFSFEGMSPSPVRSPDAVGINGLSSGVTTGGYSEPSSSEPPRPTSRRSTFEEERERLAFEASERSASEEESEEEHESLALEEERKNSVLEEERKKSALEEERERSAFVAFDATAFEEANASSAFEERKNPELLGRPPDQESHKIIQVKDAAQEEDHKPSPKLYLQFSGLTYTVCKQPSRWQRFKRVVLPGLKSPRPPPQPLRLLDGISGEARDGELLAVMGPSGSGKSTLIDALAQRIDAVKGTMTLNGNYFNERLLRNISAYVMQA
jgi:ABC-type multidrug transport system fused ATPase/permease subunit